MALPELRARWEQYQPHLEKFFTTFITRCKTDNITISAGHLAYVTLLSLVPFIMVFFTILSAFPAFATVRNKLEQFIFSMRICRSPMALTVASAIVPMMW